MKPSTKLKFTFRPQVKQNTIALSLVKTDRGVLLVGDIDDEIGPWTLVELFDDGKIALHPRSAVSAGLVLWTWDAANAAYVPASRRDADE